MNEYTILDHAGKVSHALALQHAESEYTLYHEQERQAEHIDSIRELDRDLKALKK